MKPGIEEWDSWAPQAVADRLRGVAAPWYVAGGWAVDLHLGRVTREHEDLEIGVPRGRFGEIAARFAELAFLVPIEGKLEPATPAALDAGYQTWAYDVRHEVWRFDVMREPHEGDVWISRRHPTLRRDYRDLIRTSGEGIPYLAPEVVLLFKAKHQRAKDEADHALLAPTLTGTERAWLDGALELVHPGHPWISRRSPASSR